MRVGLPTKEHLAPFIANLYSDLLINDRLQRSAGLDISGVYLRLGSESRDRLWTLYMRTYELLWKLERGQLARAEIDSRLNRDCAARGTSDPELFEGLAGRGWPLRRVVPALSPGR